MSIYKTLYDAGDRLEDHVRRFLSHYPIAYAFTGGIGVVIFWRGVWHTMDYIMGFLTAGATVAQSSVDLNLGAWWDGPLSFIIGSVLLLMTGVFVSNFIGNEIIISGLKGEKKIAEKTEKEVRTEDDRMAGVREQVSSIHQQMNGLKIELDKIWQSENGKNGGNNDNLA
ncbi:MAG: hypothetical protein P4L74_01565 [Candidatus Doudnabacteria bacterium]|nr:hypothetical protein [Candidatus Doudnabacteria bacterium]